MLLGAKMERIYRRCWDAWQKWKGFIGDVGMLGTGEFDGLRRDNCRMMGPDGWPALDTNSLTNGMGSRV